MADTVMADLPRKGDKVVVTKTTGPQRGEQLYGIARYVGITKFDVGIWIGVELGEPIGKNDGSVKGVKYFTCQKNKGLFVRPEFVTRMGDMVNPKGRNRAQSNSVKRQASSHSRSSSALSDSRSAIEKRATLPRNTKMNVTDMNMLRSLLQNDPNAILSVDDNGNTRLHHIAQKGSRDSVDALKYLLKHALEMFIHRRNNDGLTCVMIAAVARNWKSVEFLVSVGADAVDKGPDGALPSVWELARENTSTQKALRSGMEKWEAVSKSQKGRDKAFNTPSMIHQPVNLNGVLHKAVLARDMVCIRTVLRLGGNVNALDDNGNTPLHNCTRSNDMFDVAKLLISSGAKIHAKNRDGLTPVLMAAQTGHCWKIVRCLVSYGANVTDKDASHMNVFEYAQLHELSKKSLQRAMEECKRNESKGLLELVDTTELSDDERDTETLMRRQDSARRVRFDQNDDVADDDVREEEQEEEVADVPQAHKSRNRVDVDESDFGLEEVLSIPLCRRMFHKFMQESYCEENINFLEAVESYQNLFPDRQSDQAEFEIVRAAALSISEEFIVTSGVQMVNISEQVRDDIDERIEDGDFARDLFDEAGRDVFEMVDQDVFPRFVKSDVYSEMMNDADIKEAVMEIQQIKASVISEYERGDLKPREPMVATPSPYKTTPGGPQIDLANTNLEELEDMANQGNGLMETDENGNTRLHAIARLPQHPSNIRALAYLFEKTGLRRHVNTVNKDDLTPAMIAGHEKSWDMVTFFTSFGADVVFKGESDRVKSIWELCRNNRDGLSALHRGIEALQKGLKSGSVDKAYAIVARNQAELGVVLFKVCVAGDFTLVRHLVEDHHVDVNEKDREGNTVLHVLAKSQDNLRILKYFISMHAELSLKNEKGDTPTIIAARLRNWDVMQYLIRSGASPDEFDGDGETVHSYAQWNAVSQQALKDGMMQYKDFQKWQMDANDEDLYEEDLSQQDREKALQDQLMVLERQKQQEMAKVTRRHEDEIVDMVIKMTMPVDDKEDNEPLPEPAVKQESFGTYQGLCSGKKDDKRKQKACTVFIGDQAVEIHYKKGPWYKRSTQHEVYRWNKGMVITQGDAKTLLVVLDPEEEVRLKIRGCHASALEEFMARRISLSALNVQ